MARPDDLRRTASNVPNAQRLPNLLHFNSTKAQTTSLTFQQLLQLEDSDWSQNQKKSHDQVNDTNPHNKKSVLAKVKEKAKKLKYSLSGKKHRDENESRDPSTAPSSSVGQEEAKYRNSPSNVFSHAPDPCKQSSRDHPREAPSVSRLEKHCTTSNAREPSTPIRLASGVRSDERASTSNTKDQVRATTGVPKEHDSPESSSRFSCSTQESGLSKVDKSDEERKETKGESHTRDKGVSVKEYLMHKFEPGENERALSLAITQTISPRRDMVREAMSSFLKNDEPSELTSKLSNSETNSSTNIASDTNSDSKLKTSLASDNLNTNMGSKNVSFSPSHSSKLSNASSNLNQTFKSTVASYHNLGSSSNHNTSLNSLASSSGQNTNTRLNQSSTRVQSLAKTSSSPLGHGSSANETRVPSRRTKTNTIRVPASGNNNYEVIEEENRGRVLQAN